MRSVKQITDSIIEVDGKQYTLVDGADKSAVDHDAAVYILRLNGNIAQHSLTNPESKRIQGYLPSGRVSNSREYLKRVKQQGELLEKLLSLKGSRQWPVEDSRGRYCFISRSGAAQSTLSKDRAFRSGVLFFCNSECTRAASAAYWLDIRRLFGTAPSI